MPKSLEQLNTFLGLLIVFLITIFIANVSYSRAQDISAFQQEISARNQAIAKLEVEINTYNQKVATTQTEAETLKKAIQKLVAQKQDLENQISLTNLKIENTEADIFVTLNKIGDNHEVIEESRQAMLLTLREIREKEDNSIFILNLLRDGSANLSNFLAETQKLTTFNNVLTEKIAKLNGAVTNLENNKAVYEEKKNSLNSLSSDLSSRQEIVQGNQQEQTNLLTETKNEERAYQKLIQDRKNKVESLQDEINDFEAKIQYTLNKDKLPTAGDGLFWPVKDPVITQHFGSTDFAKTGAYNGHGHNGIDIGVSVGTKVMAAEAGVIMGTGDTDQACKRASYGKWVLIKHGNGLATLYGHLSHINVSEGENVTAGEQIGLSGNTGYSTGPHLHFTVIAADAVKIFGPTEYKSKVCGTYMVMPYAPLNAYLNPLEYLPK